MSDLSNHRYYVDGVAIPGVSGGPAFCPNKDGSIIVVGSISAYRHGGDSLPGLLVADDISASSLLADVVERLLALAGEQDMSAPKIALDWRFEALRRFSEAHLQGLRDFHLDLERHSGEAMAAWERACDGAADDDSARAHELTEQRHRIEGFLDRWQALGILGLYAFLESYMNLVIEQLRAGGAKIPEPKGGGFSLGDLRKHFLKVQIDLEKSPFSWSSLNQMREIRNCIAHADGWVSKEFAERLKKLGLSVKRDTPLGPPETDFERWWRLVSKTRQLIHDECSNRYWNPSSS